MNFHLSFLDNYLSLKEMIWVKLRQYRSSLCSSIAQQGTDALANSVRPTYIFDRELRILAVLFLVTVLMEPLVLIII